MKKKVAVLGATGSIGGSALSVLGMLQDRFEISVLAARSRIKELAAAAVRFHAEYAVTTDESRGKELAAELTGSGVKTLAGMNAVNELCVSDKTDIVLCAIVGTAGLEPVMNAIAAGKRIALASKEVLVMAGEMTERALAANPEAELVPVDSEHSAIFQCIGDRPRGEVKTLYLTASGGAFRDWPPEKIAKATVADALKHPTWSMGAKITIDSASMMNKALEMVEARHLFGVGPEQIKVLLHPQSVIHSMIELNDNSVIAQLARPDMRFAIQYALTWPERRGTDLPRLNFADAVKLDLREPEPGRYPPLEFARRAMAAGGTAPGAMNAANETAVEAFRGGRLSFPGIWKVVDGVLEKHRALPQSSIESIRAGDAEARRMAAELVKKYGC